MALGERLFGAFLKRSDATTAVGALMEDDRGDFFLLGGFFCKEWKNPLQ